MAVVDEAAVVRQPLIALGLRGVESQIACRTCSLGTPFTVIDKGVFPRHPLVTVLRASGKETLVQPTITHKRETP
jgi:hypothetical protein